MILFDSIVIQTEAGCDETNLRHPIK